MENTLKSLAFQQWLHIKGNIEENTEGEQVSFAEKIDRIVTAYSSPTLNIMVKSEWDIDDGEYNLERKIILEKDVWYTVRRKVDGRKLSLVYWNKWNYIWYTLVSWVKILKNLWENFISPIKWVNIREWLISWVWKDWLLLLDWIPDDHGVYLYKDQYAEYMKRYSAK